MSIVASSVLSVSVTEIKDEQCQGRGSFCDYTQHMSEMLHLEMRLGQAVDEVERTEGDRGMGKWNS